MSERYSTRLQDSSFAAFGEVRAMVQPADFEVAHPYREAAYSPYSEVPASPHVATCVSFCETVASGAGVPDLTELLSRTCWEAGFPGCERLYVGSYFCENFFLGVSDSVHQAVRELCATHGMGATLVVPIVGQAFLERVDRRLRDVLERFGDVYDEVVVNDIAQFFRVSELSDSRIGLGRLFSKEPRDARYDDVMARRAVLSLSPEAQECVEAARTSNMVPLVEVDSVSDVVDVSEIVRRAAAEVAIHLPYCYATTGRNCGPASTLEQPSEKFRLGRPCSRHCLRMTQGCLTAEGATYVKHGRTYYFPNPECQIAGTGSWRIIYAAAHDTMRA